MMQDAIQFVLRAIHVQPLAYCIPTLPATLSEGFKDASYAAHQHCTLLVVYCFFYVLKESRVELSSVENSKESKACSTHILPK